MRNTRPRSARMARQIKQAQSAGMFLERWDGAGWSSQQPSTPIAVEGAGLAGMSCSSPSTCMAVGSAGASPLVLRWDGSDWGAQTAPLPPGALAASFTAISCNARSCTAVGSKSEGGSHTVPFAERWDGRDWTVESVSVPPSAQDIELKGISCPSAAACTAVGQYTAVTDPFPDRPIAESWDGTTWSIESTAQLPGATGAGFAGVDCVSPNLCVAVGFRNRQTPPEGDPSARDRPLVERSR